MFPEFCTSFYGPHSDACLRSVWSGTNCLDAGARNPDNLPPAEIVKLEKIDLR